MNRETRQILWNQLEILSKLDPSQSAEYRKHQDILTAGFTTQYDKVLAAIYADEADEGMQNETFAILDMFRALSNAQHHGWQPSDPRAAAFQGFDGNNDAHYHFADHLLDVQGLYAESGPNKNSHSQATLSQYRRMLAVWNGAADKINLSHEDAERIITA